MATRRRVRAYDASRRQLRALETQERVLEVARQLFAERGYAETTLEEIARRGGVALPTLYASFQSKRGVLDALMKRLISGVAGGPPLLDTDEPRAINAETDARRALARFVDHLLGVQERTIPMYEVLKHAARTDSELAALLARMQGYRYSNLATLAARFAELGALRPGLSVEEASRTLWAIASPEMRQLMLGQAGWSVDRYRAWLEDTLDAALFARARKR